LVCIGGTPHRGDAALIVAFVIALAKFALDEFGRTGGWRSARFLAARRLGSERERLELGVLLLLLDVVLGGDARDDGRGHKFLRTKLKSSPKKLHKKNGKHPEVRFLTPCQKF
jgi:hypothetical protein